MNFVHTSAWPPSPTPPPYSSDEDDLILIEHSSSSDSPDENIPSAMPPNIKSSPVQESNTNEVILHSPQSPEKTPQNISSDSDFEIVESKSTKKPEVEPEIEEKTEEVPEDDVICLSSDTDVNII